MRGIYLQYIVKNIDMENENRLAGRPPKYDFSGMDVGEMRKFSGRGANIINCAKSYSMVRGLGWEFMSKRCKETGMVIIIRIK